MKGLISGQHVPGLKKLPVGPILQALKQEFEGFDESGGSYSSESGSFDVAWTDYHFSVMTYADHDLQSRIVNVFKTHKCPVYDPQRGSRYATSGDVIIASPFDIEQKQPLWACLLMPAVVGLDEVDEAILNPLSEALRSMNLGSVGGKGILQSRDNGPDMIGIDLLLDNDGDSLRATIYKLRELKVPMGTVIQYATDSGDISLQVYDSQRS